MLHKVDQALSKVRGAPRFLDATTGRQWGKTTCAEVALWMGLLAPNDEFGPPNIKIIADKYEHANLIWDKLVGHAFGNDVLRALVDKYDREREMIVLKSGARVQKLSADNPQAMTGFTLTMAIVDEAAFVQDEALELLLPCLAVRQGVLLAFGTAEGQGWHRTWYLRGQDPNYSEHWSLVLPSLANPFFPKDEVAIQERMLPRRRFEQLYLARWQSEEGAVFHNVDNCILNDAPMKAKVEDGKKYIIGVDFGRHQDWTVALVADSRTGRVVDRLAIVGRDWTYQVESIANLAMEWNKAVVGADATGVGDAVVNMLQELGVDVVPIVLSPISREKYVQKLVLALEREDIRFPRYEELIKQLKMYEVRHMPSGRDTTTAPPGFHDDEVWALCIANEMLWRGYGGAERSAIEEFAWQVV